MKQIELSPRLRMVADLVPAGSKLTDVGTDHAYLPAALLLEGKIQSAIAADLRSGPLSRAKLTASEYHLEDKISFCLCDGLAGISPDRTDAIAIAGMGGETICGILSAAPWTREQNVPLVLQPMSTIPDLRQWLLEHGYAIQREVLAQEEDTVYTAFLVRAGEMEKFSPAELYAGKNTADPLRGLWLDKLEKKVRTALDGLARSSQEQSVRKSEELTVILNGLLTMKKEWEAWQ